jgi:hypothetical protein
MIDLPLSARPAHPAAVRRYDVLLSCNVFPVANMPCCFTIVAMGRAGFHYRLQFKSAALANRSR